MKNIILHLVLTIALVSCGGKKYTLESYDNGKAKIVIEVLKGTKEKPEHYIFRAYYPTGQLYKEGEITDTVENGIWRTYYINGQVKSEGSYLDGKKNGIFNIYFRNGKIEQNGEYVDDSITKASIYTVQGGLLTEDTIENILSLNDTIWADQEMANMHMECNMLFLDDFDRGSQVCLCFLEHMQTRISYSQYANLSERQISFLMKFVMPNYYKCINPDVLMDTTKTLKL